MFSGGRASESFSFVPPNFLSSRLIHYTLIWSAFESLNMLATWVPSLSCGRAKFEILRADVSNSFGSFWLATLFFRDLYLKKTPSLCSECLFTFLGPLLFGMCFVPSFMLWYLLDLIWGCSVVPFLLKLRLRLIRICTISVTLVGVVGDSGSSALKSSAL